VNRLKNYRLVLATLFGVAAISVSVAGRAADAPVNLAPNSQWEIFSGLGFNTKMNPEGTGTMSPITVTSNTTGSNKVTLSASSTGELKNGDLVIISGTGVDGSLTIAPMRVFGLIANTSFEVQAPLGRAPTISHAATALPINVGMYLTGDLASGDAADGWRKGAAGNNMVVWREDNAVNLSPGAMYALGINMGGNTTQQSIYTNFDVTRFRGKTIAFGA